MPVPLTWLLGHPGLGLRHLAGPVDGVDIGWAHAIELADPTPWLAGGELVLTTGLRLSRRAADQAAYVDRISGAGVAALAVGVGVRFGEVPRAVVDRCAERGLPLLEVPLPTPFVAVSQAVARRLADDQQESLRRTVTLQRSLTRLTLREGAAGLVRGLAGELAGEAALIDDHGRVLAASSGSHRLAEIVRAESARRPPTSSTASSPAAASSSTSPAPSPSPWSSTVVHGPDGAVEVHALAGRAGRRGWLAVRVDAPVPPTRRVLIHHAVSLAVLHLDRPHELGDTEGRLGAVVLGLLLGAGPGADRGAVLLADFGIDPEVPVRLLAVPDHGGHDGAARSALTSAGIPHVLTRDAEDLLVLVAAAAAAAAADRLRGALARPGAAPVVGVSAPVSAADVVGAAGPARRAASAATRDEGVGWADARTVESLLADDAVRERVTAIAGATLTPLESGPGTRGPELLRSLAAFLERNGAWDPAARDLGVHRHTLRRRMDRVEELTGLALDVAEHRAVLVLALAARADGADPRGGQPG